MYLVIWEFEVKSEFEDRFAEVYGENGDWAKLFRQDESYQRSLLVKDQARVHVYMTLDFWTSAEAYESFKLKYAEEYSRIDAECEAFTIAEQDLGSFLSL